MIISTMSDDDIKYLVDGEKGTDLTASKYVGGALVGKGKRLHF